MPPNVRPDRRKPRGQCADWPQTYKSKHRRSLEVTSGGGTRGRNESACRAFWDAERSIRLASIGGLVSSYSRGQCRPVIAAIEGHDPEASMGQLSDRPPFTYPGKNYPSVRAALWTGERGIL